MLNCLDHVFHTLCETVDLNSNVTSAMVSTCKINSLLILPLVWPAVNYFFFVNITFGNCHRQYKKENQAILYSYVRNIAQKSLGGKLDS